MHKIEKHHNEIAKKWTAKSFSRGGCGNIMDAEELALKITETLKGRFGECSFSVQEARSASDGRVMASNYEIGIQPIKGKRFFVVVRRVETQCFP